MLPILLYAFQRLILCSLDNRQFSKQTDFELNLQLKSSASFLCCCPNTVFAFPLLRKLNLFDGEEELDAVDDSDEDDDDSIDEVDVSSPPSSLNERPSLQPDLPPRRS